MATDTPIHDFLLPRISALIDEAVAQGITRDVAVAVLIDLITAPRFNTAAPEPEADTVPHSDYERSSDVILVCGVSAAAPHVIGNEDEANFIKPARWDR